LTGDWFESLLEQGTRWLGMSFSEVSQTECHCSTSNHETTDSFHFFKKTVELGYNVTKGTEYFVSL
jgi:hypothetical protein